MAVDIDENEQNDKLKELWASYKNYIFIGSGLFLIIFLVFNFLSSKKIKENELASQLYQEVLIEKMDNMEIIQEKTEILKNNHGSSPYAGRASLHLGQLLSKSGAHDKSIDELKWSSVNAKEISIRSLAFYTMALNYVVLKDVPNAKISAQSIESEGFEALKNDLLGDIYLLEGNTNEARKAYAAALIFYEGRNDLSQVIQTKIDALGK